MTLSVANGTNGALPVETVGLPASGVQFVRFDILTAGSGLANEYVGLSEVRFDGTFVGSSSPSLVELSLSNAGGGASWDAGTPGNLLNDSFTYDPNLPGSTSPNHTWSNPPTGFYFLTQNNDADNYWFAEVDPAGNSVDFIDIWGNDNVSHQSLHEARGQDLVLSFFTSTDATGTPIATSAPFDDVLWSGDNLSPTFGRFDVAALIPDVAMRAMIRSFRIDHSSGSSEFLELYEVRAAGSALPAQPVPEPASIALWGMLGLGLAGFGVYRDRRTRGKKLRRTKPACLPSELETIKT